MEIIITITLFLWFGLFLDTLENSTDFPGAALALGHWALCVLQFDHSFWMLGFKGILSATLLLKNWKKNTFYSP